jgi:Domain of unknown function (DUF4386)
LRIASRPHLVGNRLALAGAILYLLEWTAIAVLAELPTDRLGDDTAAIAAAYAGESRNQALAAGWFSIVLLGRVLFAVAVRRAFRDSGRTSTLLDFAVGAMIVSVAIEVASLSLAAAGAWIADNDGSAEAIVALDAAGSIMFLMVFAPIGASVLGTSLAMMGSGLFRRWLVWLGVAAGTLLVAGGFVAAAALGDDGGFKEWGQQPSAIGALLFWIWMIATSIVLWRARPRPTVAIAGT